MLRLFNILETYSENVSEHYDLLFVHVTCATHDTTVEESFQIK